MTEAEACLASAASCDCTVVGEHEVHECCCGGKWRGAFEEDNFEIVVLPAWPVAQ